ncbi:hypothetical protein ACIPRD_17615 [Streptomyces sp. NPDC090108]|uniref:hypothetical protein n=1 Tax=Streptomyces sp. NPDC090108 TaxID=3365947 RepID=UPI003830ADE3
MDGIVFGTCAAAGVLVTALRTGRALRDPRVSNWSIAVAFGVCTLGVLFAVPVVANAAESLTGVSNVGKLVAHVCAVLWCAALQIAMVDLAHRPVHPRAGIRVRAGAAGVELALLVTLFLSADRPGIEFTTACSGDTRIAVYLLVYLAYVLLTCAELAVLCTRTARRDRGAHPWSGAGFALSGLAAALGVAYAVSKGSYVLCRLLGSPWPLSVEEKLSPVLSGLAVLLLFAGLTLPIVGAALPRTRRSGG